MGLLAKTFLALDDSNPALDSICWALKKQYDGYYFADSSDHGLELRFNPQLVYDYLRATKSGRQVSPEESRAVHTTNILASIADTESFSVDDIVELTAVGYISFQFQFEFGSCDLVGNLGADKDTTLSLLGILSYDATTGHFRIPNEIMKEKVVTCPHQLIFTDKMPGFVSH